MSVIKLVQGDNLPYIKLTLFNPDGTAIDVSSATVTVKFRAVNTTTVLSTLSCTNVTDGTDGVVKFYFPNNTLLVDPGQYEGEIEINFAGLHQTVYNVLNFLVRSQFS